jgi:hypothetical protein
VIIGAVSYAPLALLAAPDLVRLLRLRFRATINPDLGTV